MERLAVLPVPGEKCAQWSSYDRKSQYNSATDTYEGWDANGDGSGLIREENGQLVLAEMEGPGVLWRIWSALPKDGHVKIFLDGQEQPVVDLPFKKYFDGTAKPFTRKNLVYTAAKGVNSYIPIPYQKSCKIVAEKNWGLYYHFTYTTYPKDTRLPTFTRDLTADDAAALDRADKLLEQCGSDPAGQRVGQTTEQVKVTVGPGETVKVADLKGARAITGLSVKMDVPQATDEFGVLRELALRISWDDEAQPSVWSPLGDFFGTAPGVSLYQSLPLGMTTNGFYSHWYMPFGQRALVELTNDGQEERTVAFTLTHAPLTRPIASLGRFNARWHRDADLDAKRPIDWTILKTEGRGRFCGVMLYIWNPLGGWWGEGDEKFFVDGEKLPSTFGTGSEDYFGYAWCSCEYFNRPYHNQTVSVASNGCANPRPAESGGHIANNRFHIGDNIPFNTSFLAAIEKYFSNERLTHYACVAYWYQEPTAAARAPLAPLAERLFVKETDEMALYRFLRDVANYDSAKPIEPLRNTYQRLLGVAPLAAYHMELAVKAARVEKAAGHNDQAAKLIAPYVETLTVPFVARDHVADISSVLDIPLFADGKYKALLVPGPGDGSALRVQKGGRWCIATQREQRKPYIYFSLPREKGQVQINGHAKVHITCYRDDQTANALSVHYNAPGAPHRNSGAVTIPAGPAGWQTVTVECPQAAFAGRQGGYKTDFRVQQVGEGDIFISNIEVEVTK
jgi:hypothetical protein